MHLARHIHRLSQLLVPTNRRTDPPPTTSVFANLTDGVPANWENLGENVGRGRTIAIVHRALLNQPEHRQLIIGRFNRIGTGVATAANGRVFVVQVFMRI